MRIILNQAEIEAAVEGYILETVHVPDELRIDINMKATRGDGGYTAEIDILPIDAPTDGSDRSVDDRVQPTDEARAEGLGIVDAIDEARAAAKAPRRRGRPPGARNIDHSATVTKEQTDDTPDTPVEPGTEPTPDPQPEPAAELAQEETAAPSDEAAVEDQGTDQVEQEGEPEAAPEPEQGTEAALAAEAEATEPQVADEPQEDAQEPATQVNQEEEAPAPEPAPEPTPEPAPAAPAAPTRSLFANLGRPNDAG